MYCNGVAALDREAAPGSSTVRWDQFFEAYEKIRRGLGLGSTEQASLSREGEKPATVGNTGAGQAPAVLVAESSSGLANPDLIAESKEPSAGAIPETATGGATPLELQDRGHPERNYLVKAHVAGLIATALDAEPGDWFATAVRILETGAPPASEPDGE